MPEIGTDPYLLSSCLSNNVQVLNRLEWIADKVTKALVWQDLTPEFRKTLQEILVSIQGQERDIKAIQTRIQAQLDAEKVSKL